MNRANASMPLRVTLVAGVMFCLAGQAGHAQGVQDRELGPGAKAYYLYSLAQQARFERNYLDAVDHLKRAVSHDPTSAVLHLELSRLYWQLRDRERAIEEGEKAKKAGLPPKK